MELRDRLLATNLFIDNEYFEKYILLIESNRDTKVQRCKTQKHHIVPNIAFKLYNWPDADAKDNLVVLLYKDHILAHYYLALAAKQNDFKYKMVAAINFILGKASQVKLDVETLKTFTLELDKYQELYEIWRQEQSKLSHANMLGRETSEETRQKISKANSKRVYVNKDGVVRALHEDEVDLFLSQGWQLGNPNNQNRKQTTGYVCVNNGEIEKYIPKEELEKFLANGWKRGLTEAHRKASQAGTQRYMDSLTDEQKKVYASYGRLGKHCSEEEREKHRLAMLGKKHNDAQKLKNSLNKKGTIHMTNGNIDIMIKKEFEADYSAKGFYRGRSNYRRKNNKEDK